ncbi:hypothetical protein KTR66_18710 [Roseococcus sp. SDR]|uniref:hypothetical protein n=1 Tax=Roseococcus sp. SDR TaxID=2835532 RepID=UPI001BCEBF50|nr:hypothetical protein [Roseococcus sp. SDR]MBS7792039.1 hypothetical protein [Roseococcus sp. SDR]MBV1847353.1 hypothetical protein [Roseococcus sp. SDR]
MRLRIGRAALAAAAWFMLLTLPALAQQYVHVCFIEGGKREPAHFEPNGNVYVGRHATTEGEAFREAIEACERGEGSRNACQGSMTPGAICRVMDPQRAAAYQPLFRRPMNVTPGDYQCEARGTAPLGVLMGWNGQFHSTTNPDYQAARRAMEALCTSSTCDPMRCFRRSGTPVQQTQTQPQPAAGGGGTAAQSFQPGNVQYYWRQIGGNWRGPAAQNNVQACNYASAQACDAGNIRAYAPGATQMLHLNGCNAPPIQIQCVVEARNAGQGPPPANANDQAQRERFCRDYAEHGVNAASRATQARCAPNNWFNGTRTGHYDWCIRTPEQTVAAHRQSRQQALDNCLANPGANSTGGRPTGRYPPGERLIRNVGGWDLREHVRADGSFERCTITYERHAPTNVPRISLLDNNLYILSLTAHESLAAGSRIPTRYSINGRSFDGVLAVHPNRRSSMDITAVIANFAVASDARIPVRDRTYAWFMSGMPQAMTALRECRARFR